MQVTTVGGATIDVVVTGAKWSEDAGPKQDVEAVTIGVGGGAVNTSLAFQSGGARVRIVCALGGDAEAQSLRMVLQQQSIDLSQVQSIAGQPTGKAVIHLDAQGEARVFAHRGASMQLSPRRAMDAIGQSDVLYVTALSMEAEAELEAALQRIDPCFSLLAVNPGMPQLHAGTAALKRLLMRADLISMNEAEMRLWAARRGLQLPDDLRMDVAAWVGPLLLRDRQALLVTLGAHGALFHDGTKVHYIDAQPVPVCSTLGAGDAFGAALACHWAAGRPALVALEAARAYSAKVLQVATANLAGFGVPR